MDPNDFMKDEGEDENFTNIINSDPMDIGCFNENDEYHPEYLNDGFNENQKRRRPETFGDETVVDDEVHELTPFQDNQRYNPDELRPFSDSLSQLPGYTRPYEHVNPFVNPQKGPYITDEETQNRWKQWRYEQDKEEIRQIIRLNKINKIKANEDEFKIDSLGNQQFSSDIFFRGHPAKRNFYKKHKDDII